MVAAKSVGRSVNLNVTNSFCWPYSHMVYINGKGVGVS